MKELLLPPVAVRTGLQTFAALLVARDKGSTLPIFTQSHLIPIQVRSSSKVLKVVRIHTLSLVVLLIEWAPFCLEVKHVEIEVWLLLR